MKAEYFLQSKEIESATCLTNKATYYLKDLVNLLNEYARIHIEKDREEIIKDCTQSKVWKCDCCDTGHHAYDRADISKIKNRPINLD